MVPDLGPWTLVPAIHEGEEAGPLGAELHGVGVLRALLQAREAGGLHQGGEHVNKLHQLSGPGGDSLVRLYISGDNSMQYTAALNMTMY